MWFYVLGEGGGRLKVRVGVNGSGVLYGFWVRSRWFEVFKGVFFFFICVVEGVNGK